MPNENNEVEITSEDALLQEESQEDTNSSESGAEDTDVETGKSEEDSELSHKEELEKERKRLGAKIDDERKKRIDAERSKGITREEAERIADERVAQIEKKFSRNRAEELAERLSRSPEEKELILLHYDNSIKPSGSLEEDMENAFALANRKQNQAKIDELKKAALSKKNRGSSSGAGAPPEQKKPLKISDEDRVAAQFAGVSPEEFVKAKQNH